uniref:hypothetical protein n=1 Tax=Castellaniella defragrans TaxID=75697 RepID=UPI00333EAAFA
MIQLIGLMIGAYIFTRMVEVLSGVGSPAAKVFGVITILIVLVCVYGLISAGNDVSSSLRSIPRF